MTRAFIFPGQNSQFVGMGKTLKENFASARDVFAEVDEALQQRLSDLIWNGPLEDLSKTENTQPAIMAVSVAFSHVLQHEFNFDLKAHVAMIAGHSLGEYSALTSFNVISLWDAAKLLQARGRAMQAAVPLGMGGMAAVLGVDIATSQELANDVAQDDVCVVANDNSPQQQVLSGHNAAIERAVEKAPHYNIKKCVKLDVSAPFHSPLMKPAAQALRPLLQATSFQPLPVPLVSNVTANRVNDEQQIPFLLEEQVTAPVRWRESILRMREEGVTEFVEIGPGKVQSGLIKRMGFEARVRSLNSIEDIEEFLKSTGTLSEV